MLGSIKQLTNFSHVNKVATEKVGQSQVPDGTADVVQLRTAQAENAPITPQDLAKLQKEVQMSKIENFYNPELREAFDSIVNCGGKGDITLLEDNNQSWNARWKMLESAESTINSQYFIFNKDIFGLAMLGMLYKKATQDDVKVRMMVDASGDGTGLKGFKSHIGGKDYLQELVDTGNVEAKVYHPFWKRVIDQAIVVSGTAILAGNHDKIIEVDGKRGITGGRNISRHYFESATDSKEAYRDTDNAFEGREPAMALRSAFDVEFGAAWITQKVRGDWFGNWRKRDGELMGAYAMMDTWLKEKPLSETEQKAIRSSKTAQISQAKQLMAAVKKRLPEDGFTRELNKREEKALMAQAMELVKSVELRGTYNDPLPPAHKGEIKVIDKTSSMGVGTDNINSSLLALCSTAKKRIIIQNPYVVLTDSLKAGLQDAGKRGVEIWLGTNSPSSSDSALTQAFFLKDWSNHLATIPNLHIFVPTGDRKLHAKTAVVDDSVTMVGTFNMDFISQKTNSEVATVTWSPELAHQITQGYIADAGDSRNGLVEYRILRNDSGQPIRSDGLPVLDDNGNLLNSPEPVFGPENHLTPGKLKMYKYICSATEWLRKHIPHFKSLKHTTKGPEND